MKNTLAELFMAAAGPTVEYEGRIVHAAIFRQVTQPGSYLVRFVKAVRKPLQVLGMAIDKGELRVEDTTAQKIALWYDSSPDVVEVHYRPYPGGDRLSIYNMWEDEEGTVHAWLVHAGMLVEEIGNKMILRCSDGWGKPTFNDLIVEIEFLGH
jgi:hypothetical protein